MLIYTDFQGPGFVAVPNHVADTLPAEALAVLTWLARHTPGTQVYVASIQERFGWGKDRWQRVANDLRKAGALTTEPLIKDNGALAGRALFIRWPDPPKAGKPGLRTDARPATPESRETRPSGRETRRPTAGKPGSFLKTETARDAPPHPRRSGASRAGRSEPEIPIEDAAPPAKPPRPGTPTTSGDLAQLIAQNAQATRHIPLDQLWRGMRPPQDQGSASLAKTS